MLIGTIKLDLSRPDAYLQHFVEHRANSPPNICRLNFLLAYHCQSHESLLVRKYHVDLFRCVLAGTRFVTIAIPVPGYNVHIPDRQKFIRLRGTWFLFEIHNCRLVKRHGAWNESLMFDKATIRIFLYGYYRGGSYRKFELPMVASLRRKTGCARSGLHESLGIGQIRAK